MITKKTIPIYFCVLLYSLLNLNYVIAESEIEDINTTIEINFPKNLKLLLLPLFVGPSYDILIEIAMSRY